MMCIAVVIAVIILIVGGCDSEASTDDVGFKPSVHVIDEYTMYFGGWDRIAVKVFVPKENSNYICIFASSGHNTGLSCIPKKGVK